MRKNHLHYFAYINAVIILGGLLLLGFLRFVDGSQPISIKNNPVPTVEASLDQNGDFMPKTIFRTGERLTYGVDFCKNINRPAQVYASFIDTVKIDMPVVTIKTAVGCQKRVFDIFKIPLILPTGIYHLEVELVYQVNPLREVHVKYRTQDFKIINDKK